MKNLRLAPATIMVRRATARNVSISVPVSLVGFFLSLLFPDHSEHRMATACFIASSEVSKSLTSFPNGTKNVFPFVTTCQFTYSSFWFSRLHKFTRTKLWWLTNCFSDYFKCWEEIFMSFWPILLRWSSIHWKCLCSFLISLR